MPKIADVVNRCPNCTMGPIPSLGLILMPLHNLRWLLSLAKRDFWCLRAESWFVVASYPFAKMIPQWVDHFGNDCPKRSKHRNPCLKYGPPYFWVLLPHCLLNERDKKCWIWNCTAWSQDQNKAKGHSTQCLHDPQFKKTRFSSPNLS